jgi:hypothetical protein
VRHLEGDVRSLAVVEELTERGKHTHILAATHEHTVDFSTHLST